MIERLTRESLMDRTSPAPLFSLAPGGVYRASLSPDCWWALTLRGLDRPPHHFTLTLACSFEIRDLQIPVFRTSQGGMLSVALSLFFAKDDPQGNHL